MANEVKWTEEQKQAIYEKGSNILVAAAAGSGKTAVLVERIINKIINENIDIDKLLVVTFTNAAASEMRERVLNAIYKKIDEEPENEKLQKQIILLNRASICTIDSFCLDVVKNNFYELENMSPNFRIADTTEIELLKEEVLEDLFEEKYETEEAVVKAVTENIKVEVPSGMIETEVENMIKDIETRLSYQGIKFDQYLQMLGKTMEEMKKEYEPQAEEAVKTRLMLEAVIKAEKIEANIEEIDEKIKEMAKNYGKENDEAFLQNENVRNYIEEGIKSEKAVDFLVKNAKMK